MAESIRLRPYLVNGLRPHADVPRGAPYMDTFTNLMACERAAKQLPSPTWPAGFPTVSSGWPRAETFVSERAALAVVDNVFYSLNRSALTSSALTIYEANQIASVIANGTFASATGWTEASADIEITGGEAVFTNTTSDTLKQAKAAMTTAWTSGRIYEVSFDVTVSAGSLSVGTNTDASQETSTIDSTGSYTVLVTADAHADGLVFTGAGFTGTLDNVVAVERHTVSGSNLWNFAAFQDAWFATNTSSFVYNAPSTTDNKIVGADSTDTFSCNDVANWNDRLVLAGCSGARFSTSSWTRFYTKWLNRNKRNVVTSEDDTFDTSWLIIGPPVGGDSGIPNGSLLALLGLPSDTAYTTVFESKVLTDAETGLIDLFPCRHVGAILRTKVFGNDLIVYGTEGVSRIRQTEAGPVEEQLSPIGLWARGAVGGSESEHLMVGADDNMYMCGGGAMRYARDGVYAPEQVGRDFYRLGYAEYAGTINSGTPTDFAVVCYDPTEQRYWWAHSNEGFLLTKTGLCRSLGVLPSTILRLPGSTALLGAAIVSTTGSSHAVTLQTVPFDMGRRDPFIVKEVDLTTTDTAASESDRWTVTPIAKLQKQNAMTTSFPGVVADIRGRASVEMLGVEQAVKMTAVDRTRVDLDDGVIYVADPGTTPSLRKWLIASSL